MTSIGAGLDFVFGCVWETSKQGVCGLKIVHAASYGILLGLHVQDFMGNYRTQYVFMCFLLFCTARQKLQGHFNEYI